MASEAGDTASRLSRKPVVDDHSEECLAAGIDNYVTKQIRMDALIEALNQVRARDAS